MNSTANVEDPKSLILQALRKREAHDAPALWQGKLPHGLRERGRSHPMQPHPIHLATRRNRLANKLICVIATITQQKMNRNTVNQFCDLSAIRCGIRCNNNSDWHIMRIHGHMYFTVEPSFVHPNS